jgi:hypothetical protein
MKRLFLALFAALAVSAPASAQTATTPEDITLAAHEACYGVERGAALSSLATAQGFQASTRTAGVFLRNIPGFEFQLSITDKAQSDGRTLRMCSLGVWGRFAGISRVQSSLVARSRAQGFTIDAPTPRAQGGVDQMMYKETPAQTQVLSITTNEANDPTKGANYVIIYAWLM